MPLEKGHLAIHRSENKHYRLWPSERFIFLPDLIEVHLANTYTYDSFGNLAASTGSLTNSFRYTGREFDTETSLYYYRARYYDSGSGVYF